MAIDGAGLAAALEDTGNPVSRYREVLKRESEALAKRFREGADVAVLVHDRAHLVDHVLQHAWERLFSRDSPDAALVAVGGYGRGELHPGSDVDLLILLREEVRESCTTAIEELVTFLWDIGLEVGHSVRSVADCVEEAQADVSVATNLVESRLLIGSRVLFEEMRQATVPGDIWPGTRFFEAKWEEQRRRHLKYHDTAHKLEPNIKEAPGGLRDIQMVGWVAKRHFGAANLQDLVTHQFLNQEEYSTLVDGQTFLWRIRFALHLLTGRREDRLLFEHQPVLASQFGYSDQDNLLAVEHFMQCYYRTVLELERLNEMLLQLFQEAILMADSPGTPVPVNRRFQVVNGFIEVTSPDIFERYPFALLEIFLLLEQNPQIKGVRAETIRLIRMRKDLIDDDFRNDLRTRSLFMEIMRQPHGITHELRRMNRYGILAAYLPVFANIVGRMQFDLFHIYTVDVHTLFVVRNLRRFDVSEHADELPVCSNIKKSIAKPELLYLAGLFHDIAKGRGGSHSELGARDAMEFCEHHNLSAYDSRLVAWLVRSHLVLSTTAQRKDISDPEVIHQFAREVGDQAHLDYLYLLTVADIRATNPALWNSWKDAILLELYEATSRALRRGLENPIDPEGKIEETQREAEKLLQERGVDSGAVRALWGKYPADYFLRYSSDEITWHTEALTKNGEDHAPLVLVRSGTRRGGTEVFLHTPVRDDLFLLTTFALEQLGLSVVDARLMSTASGQALNSYLVLDLSGEPVTDTFRQQEIEERLRSTVAAKTTPTSPVSRRQPRHMKQFTVNTQVNFTQDETNGRTSLELITTDVPGLLFQVAQVFLRCGVQVQSARVVTIGSQAEDAFFITDTVGNPIVEEKQLQQLRSELKGQLDQSADAGNVLA